MFTEMEVQQFYSHENAFRQEFAGPKAERVCGTLPAWPWKTKNLGAFGSPYVAYPSILESWNRCRKPPWMQVQRATVLQREAKSFRSAFGQLPDHWICQCQTEMFYSGGLSTSSSAPSLKLTDVLISRASRQDANLTFLLSDCYCVASLLWWLAGMGVLDISGLQVPVL